MKRMSFRGGAEAKLVDDPIYCGPITAILSTLKLSFELSDRPVEIWTRHGQAPPCGLRSKIPQELEALLPLAVLAGWSVRRMSNYSRTCKDCGRWINLRQMPHGQWEAFEGDQAHNCDKVPAGKVAPSAKPNGRRPADGPGEPFTPLYPKVP
jgi:hypothetical protein